MMLHLNFKLGIFQLFTSKGESLHYNLVDYIASDWNTLDVIAVSLLVAAIVLRLVLDESNFYVARYCYCLTLALYFMRVMQVFDLNREIGPKIIIIRQMVRF